MHNLQVDVNKVSDCLANNIFALVLSLYIHGNLPNSLKILKACIASFIVINKLLFLVFTVRSYKRFIDHEEVVLFVKLGPSFSIIVFFNLVFLGVHQVYVIGDLIISDSSLKFLSFSFIVFLEPMVRSIFALEHLCQELESFDWQVL